MHILRDLIELWALLVPHQKGAISALLKSLQNLAWNLCVFKFFSCHHFSLGIWHTATNPGLIEHLCAVQNILYILTNISKKLIGIFAVNCFITDLYLCRHMQFSFFWVRLSKYFFFKCPMLSVNSDIFTVYSEAYISVFCISFLSIYLKQLSMENLADLSDSDDVQYA